MAGVLTVPLSSPSSTTVYDGTNRPFLTVQNLVLSEAEGWDGTPISSENDCSFPPAEPDTNVCSVAYFDTLGRRSATKDALGNLTEFAYDGLGRLITTTRYLENGTVPVVTVTEYDALGNRLSQTDAEQHDTTFVYDDFGRRLTVTDAENNVTTYEYDRR